MITEQWYSFTFHMLWIKWRIIVKLPTLKLALNCQLIAKKRRKKESETRRSCCDVDASKRKRESKSTTTFNMFLCSPVKHEIVSLFQESHLHKGSQTKASHIATNFRSQSTGANNELILNCVCRPKLCLPLADAQVKENIIQGKNNPTATW